MIIDATNDRIHVEGRGMCLRIVLLAGMMAGTAGCASMRPVDVAKPSDLTVDQALLDVAQGLNNFRQEGLKNKTNYGLIVDEVTVDLNVTAKAGDSSKLVVDASNIAPSGFAGGTIGGNFTADANSFGERGNKVTVRLKNVYTAQLNAQGLKQEITVRPGGGGSIGNAVTMGGRQSPLPNGAVLMDTKRGTIVCNDVQGGDNRQLCLDAQKLLNQ